MSEFERLFKSNYLGKVFLDYYTDFFQRFLKAIHKNDQAATELILLKEGPISRYTNDGTGETILHVAVRFGPISLVRRILELGTNINAQNLKWETPLYCAINRSAEIVQVLLDNGADVTISRSNVNLLQRSLLDGSIDTVCLLMKKLYSIDFCSNQQEIPRNDFEKCSEIVKSCLDLNIDLNWRQYPILIHFAAKHGDDDTLKLALSRSKNIDIDAASPDGPSLLHVLVDAGRLSASKIILDYGANVNQRDDRGWTALHYALLHIDSTMVLLLFDYYARTDQIWFDSKPLFFPLRYCTKDIVEMLLNLGEQFAKKFQGFDHIHTPRRHAGGFFRPPNYSSIILYSNKFERTEDPSPNYWEGCRSDIIKFLLENGADVNARTKQDITPLLVACRIGRLDVVQMLLEFGAHLHDHELGYAVRANKTDLISFLIKKGANLNAQTSDGMTPVLVACSMGYLDIVQMLLEFGADLHDLALVYAVQGCNIHLISFLIEKEANLNAQASDGMTPLLLACSQDSLNVVKLLLKFGAHLHEKVLFHAVNGGNIKLVSLFMEMGFDVNQSFSIDYSEFPNEKVTTPFHRIFNKFDRKSNVELIEFVVDNGAIVQGSYPDMHNVVIKAINFQKPAEVVCLLELKASVDVPIRKDGISPYSRFCIRDDVRSKALNQFTAFVALKGDDISSYTKKEEWNIFPFYEGQNDFDELVFIYHEILFKDCKIEVEELKNTKICSDRTVSYFDFLTKDLLDVIPFTRNETLLQVLESQEYKTKFPYYEFLLEERIKRVNRLRASMVLIEDFMHKELGEMPWIVLSKIFSFWSVGDVRNFGRALSM